MMMMMMIIIIIIIIIIYEKYPVNLEKTYFKTHKLKEDKFRNKL